MFIAWTFAIPAVAVGFALNAIPLLSVGGWTCWLVSSCRPLAPGLSPGRRCRISGSRRKSRRP